MREPRVDRTDGGSSSGNEQHRTAEDQRDKTDTDRTEKDIYRRDITLLLTRRRRYPSHRRGSICAIKSGTEDNRMNRESSQNIFGTKKKKIKMNVIHCYPPTTVMMKPRTSSTAYHRASWTNAEKNSVTILMGDFNAKIGMDNNGYEEVTHDVFEEMNESEERFADTCALTNIVIGVNITWLSPDYVTDNHIDHI